MRRRSILSSFALGATLAFAAGTVLAADPAPPPAGPKDSQEWCQKNPERCAEARKHADERRAWCAEHKEECEKQRADRQQRMQAMREKCRADPARCEEMKQRMRQMRDECQADPAKCEKMKQQMRELMQDRDGKAPPAPGAGKAQ